MAGRCHIVALLAISSACATNPFNVEWLRPTSEPGTNHAGQATYQGTMPIGNGDLTALVWPNVSAGAIMLSLSKSDAMSTGTELYKLGMVQITLDPNPFDEAQLYFNQTLDVQSGTVHIEAGTIVPAQTKFSASVWIDANANAGYVDVHAGSGFNYSVTIEISSVRPQHAFNTTPPFFCDPLVIEPDVFLPTGSQFAQQPAVAMSHRNTNVSIVEHVLRQQSLQGAIPHTRDWWMNREFGFVLDVPSASTAFRANSMTSLVSAGPVSSFTARIVSHSEQTNSSEAWQAQLAQEANSLLKPLADVRSTHVAHWNSFWNRSFIYINESAWGKPRHDASSLSDVLASSVLWLKADALAGQANGSKVAQWPDASARAGRVAQSNTAWQPTFVQGADGPSVLFDGTDDFLEESMDLPAHYTVVAVVKDMGSTTDCCSGVFFAHPGFTGIGTHVPMGSVGGGFESPMIDFSGSGSTTEYNVYMKTSIIAATYDASSSTLYVDGCAADAYGAKGSASTSVMIGTRNHELARFFHGKVMEMLVFPTPLSAANRSTVEAYLENKWSVAQPSKCLSPPSDAYTISQQFAITRYVHAIQSRGVWPIKFNGMMFVANTPPNADFRDWGPSNWWQNTRLPYGSMLATGDVQEYEVLLKYYLNILPFAKARTQIYFNHTGIYFTETKTIFGAYAPQDYGCSRPQGYPVWLEDNDYIHLDYGGDGGTPEVALAVLDYFLYTNNSQGFEKYFELVTATADFFLQHYPNRTADGRIVIWPTQALEMFWCAGWDIARNRPSDNCCVNDLPTVAGLHMLTDKLLALPSSYGTAGQRASWQRLQHMLPPLPVGKDGAFRAAEVISTQSHNSEAPELYSVHPYRIATKAKNLTSVCPLEPALIPFANNPLAHSNEGWNQGVMNAALLGLADTAATMVTERSKQKPASGYRFQGFMPHMQDYEPSADHLANMMSGLAWMILQPADDGYDGTAVLFPAWPCSWDLRAKLWAPMNTTVEIEYVSGNLQLEVTPASRRDRIVIANCV